MSGNTGVADHDELARTTLRKVTWRLGVLLFFVYVLNYLDRTNISIAKLKMQPDIALSETAFGLGAGLFFVGYVLFEVPSNMILYRVGARYWIARIMFTWGLVSMAMFLVRDEWSFYALRFLLGVAEAGLVPGVILYLSQWVPAVRRARLISVFYIAVPVSTVIGAPLSSWLMGFTPWGLTGWQFMFLVEGFPCLVMAFVVVRFLTDKPAQATWLSERQRAWLIAELDREEEANSAGGHRAGSLHAAVRDRGVLGMSFAFFAMIIPLYAMAFFLPTIVRQMGSFSTAQIGWLTAIPVRVRRARDVAAGAQFRPHRRTHPPLRGARAGRCRRARVRRAEPHRVPAAGADRVHAGRGRLHLHPAGVLGARAVPAQRPGDGHRHRVHHRGRQPRGVRLAVHGGPDQG
ncbi:MFS transporter [Amycolatopsis thermoflava]|uniref:MFS transporter n=1 Tax=Amycolatopsis thermoflava TaxID=84480 RepID=UPI0036538472